LTSRDDIAAVVKAVDRPVNVLMGLQGVKLTVTDLSAMGVRRVSIGSALCRAAYGAFLRAAREMRERGTFTFTAEAVSFDELTRLFAR
jgi:2-methylisocitrate lyase-like PEP mutase family enzyme